MTCKSWQSHPVTQSHSTSSECSESSVHQLCWLLCQAMLTAPRHHPVVAAGPIATMQLHGFATEGAIFAPRVFSALSTLPVVKTRGLTDGRCFFVDSASRMFFFTWKVIFCCAKVQLRPARTQIFGCPKKHEQGNDINDNEKRSQNWQMSNESVPNSRRSIKK